MTQYILVGLTLIVLVMLWHSLVTAYDLRKLREHLQALESTKTELQESTQWTKRTIDMMCSEVEVLRSAVKGHREALAALAARATHQRSSAQPMQSFSPEAAAAVRKRSTPRKPS